MNKRGNRTTRTRRWRPAEEGNAGLFQLGDLCMNVRDFDRDVRLAGSLVTKILTEWTRRFAPMFEELQCRVAQRDVGDLDAIVLPHLTGKSFDTERFLQRCDDLI